MFEQHVRFREREPMAIADEDDNPEALMSDEEPGLDLAFAADAGVW